MVTHFFIPLVILLILFRSTMFVPPQLSPSSSMSAPPPAPELAELRPDHGSEYADPATEAREEQGESTEVAPLVVLRFDGAESRVQFNFAPNMLPLDKCWTADSILIFDLFG